MSDRPRLRWRSLLLGAALWGLFPLAWLAAPILTVPAPPSCTFRLLTGQPCPFCGLSRAFAHAAHGQWGQAAACHPLWWLATALVAVAGLLALRDGVIGGDGLPRLLRRGSVSGLLAACLLALVVRLWLGW